MEITELKKFLIKANKPHADGTAKLISEEDGSRTIKFSEGKWSMDDNFFGGEQYGRRQVVYRDKQPYWLCVYYGQVTTDDYPDKIYDFLREALLYPPDNLPYRGPESYVKGDFEYRNKITENNDSFSGKEIILFNGKEVYWAEYLGGLVDQRFKGSV